MADQDPPKIIVDSDWKRQAQEEKERLTAQERTRDEPAGPGVRGKRAERPVDFDEIVRMLASQALLYMGAIPDPETGRAVLAPDLARLHIDMLGVLEEKTKGNLTDEESGALKDVLRELRFHFVEVSKMVTKAVEEGKIKPMDAGSLGRPPASGTRESM